MTRRLELHETHEEENESTVILSLNKGDEVIVRDSTSEFDQCTGVVVSSNPGTKGVRIKLDEFPRDNFFSLKILELYSG